MLSNQGIYSDKLCLTTQQFLFLGEVCHKLFVLLQSKIRLNIDTQNYFCTILTKTLFYICIISIMKLSSKDKIINESVEVKLSKARQLKKTEQYQQAIQMYHKVIFLKQNLEALIQMAEIYEKLMDISSAILFYKRSLQIMPRADIKQKVQTLTKIKGLQMLSIGSSKNILHDTEFSVFIKRYPFFHKKVLEKAKQKKNQLNHLNDHLLSCLAYLEVNQRQLALDALQNCLMVDEKNIDVIVLKALLNWSLMENKKGYECFWEAWKIDPNNQEIKAFLDMVIPKVQQMYKQSKYDLISKDYGKCRLKVKKALQMYPHNTKFLILSSYLHRVKQQYQQALGELEIANKTLSKDDSSLQDELRNQIALTYNQMGVYLFKHSKYEEAIKLFTEGLSYKPKDWGMYCNRGDCYKGLNDYVKALEDYNHAYQFEKKNDDLNFRLANIYNLRGIALFNSKNFENAIKQFNESIKYSPRCAPFYASKAKCYIQLGLKTQALSCLADAQKFQPNNSQINQLVSNIKEESQKKLRNNKKVITLNKQK